MTQQALSHLRVLDLTHYVAGPYCTKLAAGFGAEVIKVERPGTGDRIRGVGPFFEDEEGPERSIPFLWLNTGKKSITLDLKTRSGVETFLSLVKEADVVVENFSPRVMPDLGLGYEALRAVNPRIIMVSISNFGASGPYRDYVVDEIQLYAMSGAMHMTGEPDKAPLVSGAAICQYTAGLHAYSALLLAVLERESSGEGQFIDVPIFEGMLDNIENGITAYLQKGSVPRRGAHLYAPWGLYRCQDGYVAVICAPFRRWTRGAEIFEAPGLLDPQLRHVRDRAQRRQEVDALITPWLSRHGKKEIHRRAVDANLAFGYLASFPEVLSSAQHESRGFFEEIEHPEVGEHRYCGAPFKMSATPWRSGRAPLLGEHNEEVFGKRLGYSRQQLASLRQEGAIG